MPPRPATLQDIAQRVGVSRAVVGRVLLRTGEGVIRVGEDTARRIREAAEKLKYRPNHSARQLASRRSHALGLIMSSDAAIVTQQRRVTAIEQAATRHGYRLVIGRVGDGQISTLEDYLADFAGQGVDGIIVIDYHFWPRRAVNALAKRLVRTAIVFHSGDRLPAGTWQVRIDGGSGGRDAALYLHERGHRRFGLAFIGGLPSANNREQAFRAALAEQGVVPAATLTWCSNHRSDKLLPAETNAIVHELVNRQKATALVVQNDYWAMQILVELARHGRRVPEDVAVVGYNNLDFTPFFSPSITSFDENEQSIAEHLIAMLLARLKGERRPVGDRIVAVPPVLVRRESA